MSMWLEGLFTGGALPASEAGLRFASARHRLVLENIANADTPGYRRKDLDVGAFQEALRAMRSGGADCVPPAALKLLRDPRNGAQGELGSAARGILRHDGNDVNAEMELALLSRNGTYHNQMASLLRKQLEEIRMAIAERPTAT